jgi:nicotinate-nucleotide adenylyltransferase
MTEIYPGADLFFITGMDAVIDILQWRAPLEISGLCTIVVVSRPGYQHDKLEELPEGIRESLRFIDAPLLEISATDIRWRVRSGRCIRYLLPEVVRDYIRGKNLYLSWDGECD